MTSLLLTVVAVGVIVALAFGYILMGPVPDDYTPGMYAGRAMIEGEDDDSSS